MNKIILLLFSVLCLMGRAQGNSGWKMCVVSDVHLMAPELLKSDGKAFQDYLSSDRKLLAESVEIMDSITNRTSVQDVAEGRLGLVKADPSQITYIRLEDESVIEKSAGSTGKLLEGLKAAALSLIGSFDP